VKKIHFSNVDFSSQTGPNTFGHRLASELGIRGYEIVRHTDDYDIFLCFIEPASMPVKGKKFILRLDGIWFKPDQFETHNRNIKWAYDNSSCVVWQSGFDKGMTERWWGERKGKVIGNGISLNQVEVSSDILKIKESFNKIFVCAASWHRQKRLKENIKLFKKISNKDDALFVLGKNPDYIDNSKNIFYPGQLSHSQCLQLYKVSDWFIHLAWLDHCPNVVIEAMSQDCAIICTDSGGTKEIVRDNGIIIKEKKKYNFELADYDNPYDIEIPDLKLDNIEIDKSYIDIKNVADKYEEIFRWD